MPEEKDLQQVQESDEQFINSLLGTDEEEEAKAQEAQRIKNKNAEEARKRREAEAKAQAEAQPVEEAPAKEETPQEVKEEPKVEEVKEEPKQSEVNRLGEQLVEFKKKYPEIDLQELDNDKVFKRYIDGKLLGSKDFTALYEEFIDFKADLSGVEAQTIQRNYIKAQSSSGSSTSTSTTTGDIFSEEEMRQLSGRIPLMNPKDVAKIEEKLKRSIAYYDKK
jgi:hypothetical protein